MTKIELTERVKDRSGFTKREAADIVDAVFQLMKNTLISGDNLKIAGFGSFSVRKKSDRMGRNPQTGEKIIIPNRRIVSFKPSVTLRQRFNGEK